MKKGISILCALALTFVALGNFSPSGLVSNVSPETHEQIVGTRL